MAPDRGLNAPRDSLEHASLHSEHEGSPGPRHSRNDGDDLNTSLSLPSTRTKSDHACYATPTAYPHAATDGTSFTWRGTAIGLLIGVIICFSNTYFGLQTGWVSGMAMPASLIGFAFFKTISRHLTLPFTPVENVLVQTVAGAVGTMPLGCGFVGVMPALEFLLKKSEGAPVPLETWRLVMWSLGICLFGVVFAVPLRKEVIIREKLKFPSGTATALMIGVLHGGTGDQQQKDEIQTVGTEERHALLSRDEDDNQEHHTVGPKNNTEDASDQRADWKAQIRLLLIAFGVSALYTLVSYFIPQVRSTPVFGLSLSRIWLWNLNPSPAYVGQGIIMGPTTTVHMLLGAILGWAVLSPVAKDKGWAPGPVDNWERGSKGWIVWVSLAIMLADSIVNLGWLAFRPVFKNGPVWWKDTRERLSLSQSWKSFFVGHNNSGYSALQYFTSSGPSTSSAEQTPATHKYSQSTHEPPDDAPSHHLVSNKLIAILLPITLAFCVLCIHLTFGTYIPISLSLLATFLAVLLSIMGVRALGETDLNPVSGISKLTQLIFALVVPTGKHHDHAIIINLLAGAVSESGALQAGDMMQDLKAGHLIGASPKAQFYGQMIGSVVGAFVSAAVYKLYVSVYRVPGDMFQVPTAFVWIFTARLVTGKGLPQMAWQYALGAGLIFVVTTSLRIFLGSSKNPTLKRLQPLVPGGIAVAVGMYNTPSFTLARTIGGLVNWYWVRYRQRGETKVIVLASGLILGEGVVSIVNLVLASLEVPHL